MMHHPHEVSIEIVGDYDEGGGFYDIDNDMDYQALVDWLSSLQSCEEPYSYQDQLWFDRITVQVSFAKRANAALAKLRWGCL